MGIGSLYYFAGSVLLASWCCWSHYEGFDGAFHRPGKARKKAERQAQAQADALAKDLREMSRDRRRNSRRDETPPPRHAPRRHGSRSERTGRRRSPSRSTNSFSGQGSTIRSNYGHNIPEKRVQPTPYSDYVPEHFILNPNASGAVEPLHPVHGTQRDSHRRIPKDFDVPDPKHPGKTARVVPAMPFDQEESAGSGLHSSHSRLEPVGAQTESVSPVGTTTSGSVVPPQKRRRSEERGNKNGTLERQKRSKSSMTVEITYDENGVPRLKTTEAALQHDSILTPASPVQPPYTPSTAPPHTPQTVQALVSAIAGPQTPEIGTPVTPAPLRLPTKRGENFSLLGAFVDDSSLIITLVSYLDIPSLISWYAIDKKFHWYYNKNYTAFILASVRTWAPEAETIFPWRHYEKLCIKDPVKRQKVKSDYLGPDIAQMNLFSRDVPSLRWLQMVVWREGVVKDMVIQLATRALRVPPHTRDAIKRLWFVMDLPLNAHRISCIQSKRYIANSTLKLATIFFLKLDMFFTDPGYPLFPINHPSQSIFPNRWANGIPVGSSLKEILLAERSLTPLWRVLRGWAPDGAGHGRPIEHLDILKLWMRHKFRSTNPAAPPATDPNNPIDNSLPIMGLRMEEFVQTGYQPFFTPKDGTPFRPIPLMTVDLLVMSEAMRRKIDLQKKVFEMMSYGFGTLGGRRVKVFTEEEILRQERAVWTSRELRIIRRNEERERVAEEMRSKLLEVDEVGGDEDMGDEDISGETAMVTEANEAP
ncbi:hypothetical protein CERZMDRAFT_101120 [Cercospora zeae-maydis SCOH1-5]|uniref:Uncharacterized protein n=1 Tax=Cercospora zeae-maydis SCOH1-5 TaxID=717836 RepID=A0A6A6F5G8_9PEZI|nr:hypothetical protein CERZMDRAFT_101120 [Cercospora zeae-maydis SCOH1-5]